MKISISYIKKGVFNFNDLESVTSKVVLSNKIIKQVSDFRLQMNSDCDTDNQINEFVRIWNNKRDVKVQSEKNT